MDDAVEGRRRAGWIALVFLLPALVLQRWRKMNKRGKKKKYIK